MGGMEKNASHAALNAICNPLYSLVLNLVM